MCLKGDSDSFFFYLLQQPVNQFAGRNHRLEGLEMMISVSAEATYESG